VVDVDVFDVDVPGKTLRLMPEAGLGVCLDLRGFLVAVTRLIWSGRLRWHKSAAAAVGVFRRRILTT
jgi:hypothetical protein